MSFISKYRWSVDDSAVLRVGVPATRSNTIARVVTSPAVNTGDAGRTWSSFNSQTNSPTILPGRKAFAASFIDSDEDIFSAIAAGDLNAVHISMQSGTDPNVIDAFQEPALHYVIRRQNRRIFSLFITLGVNVNASDLFGRTALHVAVGGEDSLFVDYLLRAGANPAKQDQVGVVSVLSEMSARLSTAV
ncbi:hypothetical protein SARC_07355 [Sphaeroforma arctica JP610]|uniref:Uncharacterized protein n=1 Tax=Sphaeroforma arctica JP610 TaxID=667725 RepID=A0A0L0FTX1_9EUKA|nr:hypothetical protein SARC_07355 [Sphaeroforma arctica JP610]KNC80290.1 hypothetical protein SARC_07355 [Sphaeroforma arctica JP610]|eukprot:XP_014154192.1 hypothetical protein SARC_07355 [Sphaeroforma arctica JP610]